MASASKKTVASDTHAHYTTYLFSAAFWALPTILLAVVVLSAVQAGVQGLAALAAKTPAGPLKKLVQGLHAVAWSTIGTGTTHNGDPKCALLAAVLIALLVVAGGVWELVGLKSAEMQTLLGERPGAEAVQRAGAAARPRRGSG